MNLKLFGSPYCSITSGCLFIHKRYNLAVSCWLNGAVEAMFGLRISTEVPALGFGIMYPANPRTMATNARINRRSTINLITSALALFVSAGNVFLFMSCCKVKNKIAAKNPPRPNGVEIFAAILKIRKLEFIK